MATTRLMKTMIGNNDNCSEWGVLRQSEVNVGGCLDNSDTDGRRTQLQPPLPELLAHY